MNDEIKKLYEDYKKGNINESLNKLKEKEEKMLKELRGRVNYDCLNKFAEYLAIQNERIEAEKLESFSNGLKAIIKLLT